MNILNKELKKYIDEKILPEYLNFDEGHGVKHITDVRDRSLEYFEDFDSVGIDLDINMVYVVACYHDLGMKIERKNHAIHSAELLHADKNLKKWFSDEQIEIMAEAVADHSTSSENSPRSLYGMIVSDADKDRDIKVGIIRAWKFFMKNHPNATFDECAEDVHREIVKRFGGADIGGKSLVKFYLPSPKTDKFMKMSVFYAYNKDAFIEDFKNIVEEALEEEKKKAKRFGE